jgi:hypothetical protein
MLRVVVGIHSHFRLTFDSCCGDYVAYDVQMVAGMDIQQDVGVFPVQASEQGVFEILVGVGRSKSFDGYFRLAEQSFKINGVSTFRLDIIWRLPSTSGKTVSEKDQGSD